MALVLAGVVGSGVASSLSSGGFDDPAAARAGRALIERRAAEPGLVQVASYWSTGAAPLRSDDGTRALVLGRVPGTEDEQIARVEELVPEYTGTFQGLEVAVGGEVEVFRQVGDTIERDLERAEAIAFPVTAVLLVLVFGSAVAAGLPLLVGVLPILGTFAALRLVSAVTDVSVYSLDLAISLGLGLGIDYSLFVLTRYREELRAGRSEHDAVVATVRTAGRTVLFSGLTVLLSLGALLLLPLAFLRSFAYAGTAAVLFAVLGAVVVLPAALAVLGRRVDSLDLRRPLRRALRLPATREREVGEGAWHRVAVTVVRRPLPVATAVVAVLVLAGLPFTGAVFGLPDDRVLPRDASAHVLAETVRTEFAGNEPLALTAVAPAVGDVQQRRTDVDAYAVRLSALDGVERVDALTGTYVDGRRVAPGGPASARFASPDGTGTYLSVVPSGEGYGPEGEQLVQRLRAAEAPFDDVVVGGRAAQLVDTKASLGGDLPLVLGVIAVATSVLLFLFTGSIVVPVKAVLLDLLSLSATFGAMVWVFQEGHLGWLVGDPIVTGTLDTTMPILTSCVLFGLSMDYEVFLLSRIREEHLRTGDNARAVAVGLERTGRLISAAAGLLALVFLPFVSSDISFIELLGLGTALAVVVDATLVRGALVPAFMRLAGDLDWWAPAPLRRLHDRFGLTEPGGEEETGGVSDLPDQRTAVPEPAGV